MPALLPEADLVSGGRPTVSTHHGDAHVIAHQVRRHPHPHQFVLPDDIHDGPVSAVGTFNDWVPGAHKLVRRNNGTRSVSVAVPAGQAIKFRYLGAGGVWFDDEDADVITPEAP